MRMDRFRRSGAGADHYERKLAEALAAGTVAEATHHKGASGNAPT